jgi:hypothetical protein
MTQTTRSREAFEFVLADEKVTFPGVAAGSAVKNAAKRFETAYRLPAGAAFALAAASVDPSAERGKIPAHDPSEHLTLIPTPSNELLACHPARLWSPLVSGDGSNGRSRFALQTTGDDSVRPWPIARHLDPAIVEYAPHSVEDMAIAAEASANQIRSTQLLAEIGRHEKGVWNPPVVVLARAIVDGEEHWFLHTIEGSTRIEACHELTEVEAGAPLRRSDAPLDHLREVHGEFVEWFETMPTSPEALAAARATTIPAFVVVGLIGEDGQPLADGFPDVVNSYVESVHVQPRPFSPVAMNNVLGERLLLTLRREGRLDFDSADQLLGRLPQPEGKPSVRGAELVNLICDQDNEGYIREIMATEGRKRLTKDARARLIGPLVLRQFEKRADSAERALTRSFTPDVLIDEDWEVSGATGATLRRQAISRFEKGEHDHPVLLELVARGGPALCAAGLLLSDQGSTVEEKPELRGTVNKVLEGLLDSLGGIEVLAEATAWADGSRSLLPQQRRPDGTGKTDKHGEPLHYASGYRKGNMKIRALALNDGVVPGKKKRGDSWEPSPSMPPEEAFRQTETQMLGDISAAYVKFRDLYKMTDDQGRKLIGRIGLSHNEIVEPFTRNLSLAYAHFGDDPLADLDEDQLPDVNAAVEDEEEE